jgi:hypothetical protein
MRRSLTMPKAIRVSFSYSHEDEVHRDELAKHLRQLEREGAIENWHDRKIEAGDDWKRTIDARLESADVILLLVSSDFLASEYCVDLELKRALERSEAGATIVIPVIVRACDWTHSSFAKLQALPRTRNL